VGIGVGDGLGDGVGDGLGEGLGDGDGDGVATTAAGDGVGGVASPQAATTTARPTSSVAARVGTVFSRIIALEDSPNPPRAVRRVNPRSIRPWAAASGWSRLG
jgi:hypothetical protein